MHMIMGVEHSKVAPFDVLPINCTLIIEIGSRVT